MQAHLLSSFTALSLFASAGALVACSNEPSAADDVEVVRSSLSRDTAPALSTTDEAAFASDQASFAADIYQAVRKDPRYAGGDIFLSPQSISTALAMTYAGARAQTAQEMKRALHFGLADTSLHAAFNWLDLQLSSRGQNAQGQDGKPFRLHLVNSIWGQKGTAFESPFLDTLAVNYGAGLNVLDFVSNTEAARAAVNEWVEAKTEERIKDLLGPGSISGDTRLVLVNAVYFNASWAEKFAKEGTSDEPFTKLDGTKVSVPTMHGKSYYGYLQGDGFEAVELPYQNNELSMVVIAPTSGTFDAFEARLTGDTLLGVLAGLRQTNVVLQFPKVKLESSFSLVEPLQSLGMKAAFESGADFSGITAQVPLVISDVLHKTFLAIDEDGTEAAAATAVVANETSAEPLDVVHVNIDRPFITAIVDKQTKSLVFMGRVLEPKR